MENVFSELIKINSEKKSLEIDITHAKNEFENSIFSKKDLLDKLIQKESKLKEEVILTLEKNKTTDVVIDDKIITKQIKKTTKIEDPETLYSAIKLKGKELTCLGISVERLLGSFENKVNIKVQCKKDVMDAISKYEDVEGVLLNGVVLQETKFIVIK